MRIILTNLFTTLWCQRKRIRDAYFNSSSALPTQGGGTKLAPKITILDQTIIYK